MVYVDKKRLNALLKWYMQEIGEELIAALVVDREGLLIDVITRSSEKTEREKFIGAFSALVDVILKKITHEFDLGRFGSGSFDTDQYRFIFCEAGPELVFVTVFDALTQIDPYFAYSYLTAEKVARIFDGRTVSPVIPTITIDQNLLKIERKVDTFQKFKVPPSEYIYKLILGGDGDVGKTSMVQRFVEGTFQEDYKATIGTHITKKECDFEGLDSSVRFMIWDLAGQPQFRRIRQAYAANAGAGILVYDVTNRESFKSIRNWTNLIKESALPEINLILAGNKIDLEESRIISKVEGEKLAKELGISYIETSAKTGENINDAFKVLAFQLIQKYVEAEEIYKIQKEDEGKLASFEKIPVKEIWKDISRDFTPWLENNIEALNDALDLSLKPIEKNVETGELSVDILAKDKSGNMVIIENQFGKTETVHLGNLLTSVANNNAKKAIWICEEPLKEHVKLFNWLNENTIDTVAFYIVKIEVYKIYKFRPMPKFVKVSGPSVPKSEMFDTNNLNEIERKRLSFWEQLVKKVNNKFPLHANMKVENAPYVFKKFTKEGLKFNYVINENWSAIELCLVHKNKEINQKRFSKLENNKQAIQKEFSEISWHLTNKLEWDFENNRNYQCIRYRFDKRGLRDGRKWNELQNYMIDAMKCLISSTQKHIDII